MVHKANKSQIRFVEKNILPKNIIQHLRTRILDTVKELHTSIENQSKSPQELISTVKTLINLLKNGAEISLSLSSTSMKEASEGVLTTPFGIPSELPNRKFRKIAKAGIKSAFDTLTLPEIKNMLVAINDTGLVNEFSELFEPYNDKIPLLAKSKINRAIRNMPKLGIKLPDLTYTDDPEDSQIDPEDTTPLEDFDTHEAVDTSTTETLEVPEVSLPPAIVPLPDVPQEKFNPENFITVIKVPNLLPLGELKVSGTSLRREKDETVRQERFSEHPRLQWLFISLYNAGFKNADMFVYVDDKENKNLSAEKNNNPYDILEVSNQNARFQIAITDRHNFSTFVIKSPYDKDTLINITTTDLRKNDDVYRISFYSRDYWERQILRYALTPREELETQIKTYMRWGDKKSQVVETLGEFVLQHMKIPSSRDNTIVDVGPLAGQTCWDRIGTALYRGAIAGLENTRNFRQLAEEIFGENINLKTQQALRRKFDAVRVTATALAQEPQTQPEPAFEIPVRHFDVRDVFKIAAEDIVENALLSDPVINRAFGDGNVDDLEKIFLKKSDIRTTRDFLVETQLAIADKDGVVMPIPDKKHLHRTIQLTLQALERHP